MLRKLRQSDYVTETVNLRRMASAQDEAQRLIALSGLTQYEVAAYLSQALGRRIEHWQVSRMTLGKRKIAADEMDALRRMADTPDGIAEAPAFFQGADQVPLFAAPSIADNLLRLGMPYQVGLAPLHPAQRGSRGAFAFIMPDDTMGERLRPGEVGYAIRNRPPFPSQACLIELKTGECIACLFQSRDANTVMGAQLHPKKTIATPVREIEGVHAIVGTSFQGA